MFKSNFLQIVSVMTRPLDVAMGGPPTDGQLENLHEEEWGPLSLRAIASHARCVQTVCSVLPPYVLQ